MTAEFFTFNPGLDAELAYRRARLVEDADRERLAAGARRPGGPALDRLRRRLARRSPRVVAARTASPPRARAAS